MAASGACLGQLDEPARDIDDGEPPCWQKHHSAIRAGWTLKDHPLHRDSHISCRGRVHFDRMRRLLALLALCALTLAGESEGRNKLGLPNPAKQDIPYLIQASEIHELEETAATPEEVKNQMRYWMPGTVSAVKTPLASPEFLFDSKDIDPRDLSLFRFEVVKGRRELLYRKKKKVVARAFFLNLEGVENRVVRIRVNSSLEPGEYGLTPDGRDTVFTFAVF